MAVDQRGAWEDTFRAREITESGGMQLDTRGQASRRALLRLFVLFVFAHTFCALLGQTQNETGGGQFSRIEADLLRALKNNPQNGSLWFSLGVARAQAKRIDSAIEAFEKALPLTPEPAPVYFDLGVLYMQKNDGARAEAAYRSGLTLYPSNAPANQNYALLLMQRGEFREATIPLERLKGLQPSEVSTRATLIEAYLKAGLKKKGEDEIDTLMTSRLATLPQGLALARLLLHDKETDAARRVLESLRDAWPNSAETHGELGLALIDEDRFNDAANGLRQAVRLDAASLKYSRGLGEALISSRQYPEALEFLQSATRKFPNQPNLQYQLAFVDVCLQRFTEAVSILDDLERETPGSARVQFLLGGAYELQGELEKGEAAYRRAILRAPEEAAYYRVLASLLQRQGAARLDEAQQLAKKAVTLDPADGESKIVLARCLEKQGRLDEAATLLQQAVGSNPDSRHAHTALAEVYRRRQKLTQAEQEQAIAGRLEDKSIQEWTIWGRDVIPKHGESDAAEPLDRPRPRGHDDLPKRVSLIAAYLKSGKKKQADEEIDSLLAAHLAGMKDELSLARLLTADGKAGAAGKVLRHAALTWPDAAEPHGDLGLLSLEAGHYETAVGELGRAAQIDPNSARYALGLGEALLRWRHDPVALDYLLAVREKFETYPLYKFELALAYFYLTRYPLALQEFESLAKEQPQSSRVQYLLGGAHQAMGNLEQAEECYRRAIELKPDEASYYITLASLLRKVVPADLAEPVRLLEKALALNPRDAEGRLLLASCYQTRGRLTEAQSLLEALVASSPELRGAHVALAKVYYRQKRVADAQQQESIAAKLEDREQSEVSPWGPGGVPAP